MAVGIFDYTYATTHNWSGVFSADVDRRRPKIVPTDIHFHMTESSRSNADMEPAHAFAGSYDLNVQQNLPPFGDDPNWSLQRSFSTPNVVGPSQQYSDILQPGAAGEKKRNKLGYHRTSVACSHCRKRKIRCIASPSDRQGRCSNCIRLKKDCSFIPTDQPQSSDSRSHGPGTSQSESRDPSESSSPGPVSGSITSKQSPRPYPPSLSEAPGLPHSTTHRATAHSGVLPSMNSAGQIFDSSQQVPSWMANGVQSFMDGPPTTWNNPWRPRPLESSLGEQVPEGPLSATWAQPVPGSGARDTSWGQMNVPPRSFSYSGESLNGPSTAPFLPIQHSSTSGRQAFASPPMTMANMDEGFQSGMGAGGPVSPVEMTPQVQMHWQQQQSYMRAHQFDSWSQGQTVPVSQGQHDGPSHGIRADSHSSAVMDGSA